MGEPAVFGIRRGTEPVTRRRFVRARCGYLSASPKSTIAVIRVDMSKPPAGKKCCGAPSRPFRNHAEFRIGTGHCRLSAAGARMKAWWPCRHSTSSIRTPPASPPGWSWPAFPISAVVIRRRNCAASARISIAGAAPPSASRAAPIRWWERCCCHRPSRTRRRASSSSTMSATWACADTAPSAWCGPCTRWGGWRRARIACRRRWAPWAWNCTPMAGCRWTTWRATGWPPTSRWTCRVMAACAATSRGAATGSSSPRRRPCR